MNTDKELMQQALEALENTTPTGFNMESDKRFYAVITALRERLAQHEALDQLIADSQSMGAYSLDQVKAVLRQDDPQFDERMQRARERLVQTEQEPVAWMFQHEETGRTMCVDAQQLEWGFEKGNPRLKKIAPLYTTPPQRKPLTDEEIMNLCASEWASHPIEVARIIEATHGIGEKPDAA